MSRVPVVVRDAEESDAPALSLLWADQLTSPVTPSPESLGTPPETLVERAVQRTRDDSDSRIVVAEIEGEPVGCAFLRTGQVSPLHEDQVVHLSHVQVDPDYARQGVGRALMESAMSWAEQRGIAAVVAATAASDREANRFLARLGLAQVATLRGASVAALRARLPHDPSAVARNPGRVGRSVGQVVAARRSQRRARGVRAVGAAD